MCSIKHKKIWLFVSLIIVVFFVLLWSSNYHKEKTFQNMFSDVSMNQEMKVILKGIDSLDVDKHPFHVWFVFENISSDEIQFRYDYEIQIFYYNFFRQSWEEVVNRMPNFPDGKIHTIKPKQNGVENSGKYLSLSPDLSKNSFKMIRVVAIGDIVNNDGMKKRVGVYYDIFIP